jgi:hypothetical protein
VNSPPWIEAISTAVAAFAAIIAAIFTGQTLRRQIKVEERQLKIDERQLELMALQKRDTSDALQSRQREQATLVTFMSEHGDGLSLRVERYLRVTNKSQQPIFNVYPVTVAVNEQTVTVEHVGDIRRRLDPQDSHRFSPAFVGLLGACLVFQDAAGRTWSLNNRGELRLGKLTGDDLVDWLSPFASVRQPRPAWELGPRSAKMRRRRKASPRRSG